MFYDISEMDGCVNEQASCGEICVGCNCCGRFDEDCGAGLSKDDKDARVTAWWAEYKED